MKKSKFFELIYSNKYAHYMIILIVTLFLSIHMMDFQIYDTHDGSFHLLRILVTNKQLHDGLFPPIISPYSFHGIGVGMNLFYPPISTYVPIIMMSIFKTTAGNALKLFSVLSIFLSGLFMYLCMIEFTRNRKIAIISAIVYIIMPYKLNNIYVRVAAGEIAASVFIPLVFLGLHNLIEGDGNKHFIITVGAVGIILSHTISSMYIALFSFIYVIINFKVLIDLTKIKRLVVNIIFIVLISGVFVFPYIETTQSAKYIINTDECMGTYDEFLNLKRLGLSHLFSNREVENNMILYLGMPTIIGLVLAIISVPLLIKNKNINKNYTIFLLFSVLCIWMSTKYFSWDKLPKIFSKLQFPWRMMGFGCFFMSYIVGVNYVTVLDKIPSILFIKEILIFLLCIISIIKITQFTFTLKTWGVFNDNEIEKNWESFYPKTNLDFAPFNTYSDETIYNGISMTLYSNNRDLIIINEEKSDRLYYSATVKNLKKGDIISIPYLYYPYYELEIVESGKTILKEKPRESYNGMIEFEINKLVGEKVDINIYYKPSVLVILSYLVSLISVISFIIYVAYFNIIIDRKEKM